MSNNNNIGALPSAALAPQEGLSPEAGSQAKQPAANAGFTPGPWLVNPLSAWVEVPGKDEPICAMLWPTELRSEDETFANARLIAAAPELLEALHELLGQIEQGHMAHNFAQSQSTQEATANAWAAIRKALVA